MRRLFGRRFVSVNRDDRSDADSSWEDSDHRVPPVEEHHVADPWDSEFIDTAAAAQGAAIESGIPLSFSQRSSEIEDAELTYDRDVDLARADATSKNSNIVEFLPRAEETDSRWARTSIDDGSGERFDELKGVERAFTEERTNQGDFGNAGHFGPQIGEYVHVGDEGLGDAFPDDPVSDNSDEWTEILVHDADAGWTGDIAWTDGLDLGEIDPGFSPRPDTDLDLSDYDDDARQSPWPLESGYVEESDRRASMKAAAIANLLETTKVAERNAALRFLTDLFAHSTHSSTYRAIRDLAVLGLDFKVLQDMVELRRIWADRTDWWLHRHHGQIRDMSNGATALDWKRAHNICVARWQLPPELMIDDEWLDEWIALRAGASGYYRFLDFVIEKVNGLDAEILHHGLISKAHSGDFRELADHYDWNARVPDRQRAATRGFRFITPYDDRPGVIRHGPKDEKDEN